MAGSKSSQSRERSAEDATRRLNAVLDAFFATRPLHGKRICIGLSGGIDSVVLLHAMRRKAAGGELTVSLSAEHVHHGISPHADEWTAFCAGLCREYGVPFAVTRVEVPRDSGEGLEAAARRLRYDVFAGNEADWLLLAHHRDDQAETVLLNLLRGAGVAGAAGMLAERPRRVGPALLRPLLEAPRELIERYAAEHGLLWVDDDSNIDRHFRRNFLRHEILPRLEEKFQGAGKSLARAAGHFAEASGLLDELAMIDHNAIVMNSGRLSIAAFNGLPLARAHNLLRYVWTQAGFRAPDARWIDEACKQLATADALSETCVATSDGELHVYRGEIHLLPQCAAPPDAPLAWSGQEALPWAGGQVRFVAAEGQGLRRSLLAATDVQLRLRSGGERLRPDARRPRRSLRNLLQERAIPPWERSRLPLLWVDDQLAWVGDIGGDASFACPPGEEGILPCWESDC